MTKPDIRFTDKNNGTAPYQAPPWLPGAHLQTIFPLARKGPAPSYRRERWETPDGDFIDLDWLTDRPGAPLVVLFHGLEGSSRSHYARALMRELSRIGWNGVVPHFRGCSGEPNRLERAYHSGDSDEVDWILRRIAAIHADIPRYAVGVSLGGNALLKWLGEQSLGATGLIDAAAAVCPPLDLNISGHALGAGFNRIYTLNFLATLKRKALHKLGSIGGPCDLDAVRQARTLHEFDDAYTAPLHGFHSADDYWTRASSRPWLRHIAVPTLLINARNDPFVPIPALPEISELSPAVRFETPVSGGHVGFLDGRWPGHLQWLPRRVLAHFQLTGSQVPHPAIVTAARQVDAALQ